MARGSKTNIDEGVERIVAGTSPAKGPCDRQRALERSLRGLGAQQDRQHRIAGPGSGRKWGISSPRREQYAEINSFDLADIMATAEIPHETTAW
jgi:hypothetical protein